MFSFLKRKRHIQQEPPQNLSGKIMPSDLTDENLYLPQQPDKLIKPDMTDDVAYIEQCKILQFQEEYDSRKYSDLPGSERVLSPLNSGDFKTVLREVKSFITKYPDLDMCYQWWARSLYEGDFWKNEARGNFELGRYALHQGLEHSKMKYKLCAEFGYLESFDESLTSIERIRAAVFWWVQGIHGMEAILQTATYLNIESYLCLASVAEGTNHRELGLAFKARADQINDFIGEGRTSLDRQAANRIVILSRKEYHSPQAGAVEVVLNTVRDRYRR